MTTNTTSKGSLAMQRVLWGVSGATTSTALFTTADIEIVLGSLVTSFAAAAAGCAALEGGKLTKPRMTSFIMGFALAPNGIYLASPGFMEQSRMERRMKAREAAMEPTADIRPHGLQHYNAQTNTLKVA